MKRAVIALIALAAIAIGTACQPPTLVNGGWTKARTPNRTSITVGNPSAVMGHDMIESVKEFNTMAGWKLLDVYPVNDQYGLVNADIRFGVMSPICANGNCADRRAAWVQRVLKADGSMHHCNIWYDPAWLQFKPWQNHPDTWSHEIHHCLGFTGDGNAQCDPNLYAGVGSYCNMYAGMNLWYQQHQPPWWDATEQQALTNVGYR